MNHAIEIVTDDDSPTIRCERPSFERVSRHSLIAIASPIFPTEQSGAEHPHGAGQGKAVIPGQFTRAVPWAPTILASLREWVRVKLGLSRHITFAELRVIDAVEHYYDCERAWNEGSYEEANLKAWSASREALENAAAALRKERGR